MTDDNANAQVEPSASDPSEPGPYRHKIHEGSVALVEDWGCEATWTGEAPRFEVVFYYVGLINYTVGRQTRVIDVNQTVFVKPGGESIEALPTDHGRGCRCIVITPAEDMLEEICDLDNPALHPAFRATAGLANAKSRLIAHKLLRLESNDNQLAKDELVTKALVYAMDAHNRKTVPSRVVDRARQLLHERDYQRMSLTEIANEVGVAPVYLTQEFTRSLGMPMYKYQLYLRLNRALIELPHCESITELALALDFSSHSHFTAAFRATFGITPSAFRDMGTDAATKLLRRLEQTIDRRSK